ncbi:MAG: 50S ribosomal protein L10 [Anaerolineae bacterium]|nr:MAG: 50S ribosomal protein L10 [Anaerolineae bacterium]
MFLSFLGSVSLCLCLWRTKTFLLKGGDKPLAISKQRKVEILAQYKEWLERSQGAVLMEYIGLDSKAIEQLRRQVREAGGEFHVVKNTLGKRVFDELEISFPDDVYIGSTGIAFAFTDVPPVAKTIVDFAKEHDVVKVKAGILDGRPVSTDEVKALADLPPLPVMRAQLLGTIMAPASKLVRTLAEPGRGLAAVVKAYSEKE